MVDDLLCSILMWERFAVEIDIPSARQTGKFEMGANSSTRHDVSLLSDDDGTKANFKLYQIQYTIRFVGAFRSSAWTGWCSCTIEHKLFNIIIEMNSFSTIYNIHFGLSFAFLLDIRHLFWACYLMDWIQTNKLYNRSILEQRTNVTALYSSLTVTLIDYD